MYNICLTEVGRLKLSYEITVTVHDGISFYGVRITSTDENGLTETKSANDITSDKDKIEALVNLMNLGNVTPVTLEDIVSDFIE